MTISFEKGLLSGPFYPLHFKDRNLYSKEMDVMPCIILSCNGVAVRGEIDASGWAAYHCSACNTTQRNPADFYESKS